MSISPLCLLSLVLVLVSFVQSQGPEAGEWGMHQQWGGQMAAQGGGAGQGAGAGAGAGGAGAGGAGGAGGAPNFQSFLATMPKSRNSWREWQTWGQNIMHKLGMPMPGAAQGAGQAGGHGGQ